MKKYVSLILALMMLLTLCSCGDSEGGKDMGGGSKTVEDVLNQQTAEDSAAPAETDSPEIQKGAAREADVDLTALNSTMVYSTVYDMLTNPDEYIGKTVIMRGGFAMYHDEVTDKYYFACIIADATACCSQGVEFVLAGEHRYPEDYPELGEEVTVYGNFDTYKEDNNLYCTLRDAEFL